ncbi:MAG: HAMP domain-containing histidine kinase [Synergistaceae bacterium]|nr:HAMP domain-containing histidine kinase [Synergistaceae bacterium]
MRLKLKTKLAVSYAALAVFLVASLLLVSNYFLDKQFQIYVSHKQDMKNMEIAAGISNNFPGSGAADDEFFLKFLDDLGRSMLAQGVVIMVFDGEGRTLYCTSIEPGSGCGHVSGARKSSMSDACPDFGSAYSQESFDIVRDGAALGSVMLGYHDPFYYSESDQSFLSAFNKVFFAMSALFLAASAAIGLVMAGRISGPIARVTERTRRIAEGDYSERVGLKTGTAEIDALSEGIDHLAESLQTQFMLKRRMAVDYSHEFRTPLAVLQSNLEAMIDGLWIPTKERLESLLDEIFRMSRMVSDVDDLVKAGNPSASLELDKVPSDISDMAERIIRGFETNAAAKGVLLSCDRGECDAPVDRDKFSQVIWNLVSNAVKYTDRGGIRVSASNRGDMAVLVVEDDGIGIAESDMPYIFEHLYRTDESRARGSGGNGVGLSVVKAIVESHGGHVEARSEPGCGSAFTVSVPRAQAPPITGRGLLV